MKIQVTKKSQYGRERVFPVDDKAKLLTVLTKRATFNFDDIQTIGKIGFEIEYVTLPSMDQARDR